MNLSNHLEWFGFTNNEDLIALGRHETFFEADEAAPVDCVWIFSEERLRSFQLRIDQLLDAVPDPEQEGDDGTEDHDTEDRNPNRGA